MTTRGVPGLPEVWRRLREGGLRAVVLFEAAEASRTASHDPVGPYKTWDAARSRWEAEAADAAFGAGMDAGALHGIPVSFKDLFGVQGWPTYAGTGSRLPEVWEREGPVVRAVRSQLGVVMGKTHTVELAFGGLGTNPHWGTPRNPWDERDHRVPGGSSAGAAVSLMEGSALLAFGTDTAGSVRIPASMTGVAGLKTSYGRWSTDGVVPLSTSLDSVGLLARTVEDMVFGFEAVEAGVFGLDGGRVVQRDVAGCRFGVPDTFFWDDVSPGVAEAVREGIRAVEAAGAKVVPLEIHTVHESYEIFLQGALAGIEVAVFLANQLPEVGEHLDPAVRDRIRAAEAMPAAEYIRRKTRLAALGREAATCLEGVDALITPTVALSPPRVQDLQDLDAYRRSNLLALRNTCVGNLLSLCAVSLPCGRDALGLPVGMQLVAPWGRDAALLGVARAVERCGIR